MFKWLIVAIGSIVLYAVAHTLAFVISMFTGVDVNWLTLAVLLVIGGVAGYVRYK